MGANLPKTSCIKVATTTTEEQIKFFSGAVAVGPNKDLSQLSTMITLWS